MTLLKKGMLILSLIFTSAPLIAQEEPEQPPIIKRLSDLYEQTDDLAIVYYIATIYGGNGFPAEMKKWLLHLEAKGWCQGIEMDGLPETYDDPEISIILTRMNACEKNAHMGELAFTFKRMDIFPESIAYNPETGAFYAGSIKGENIVIRNKNGDEINFTDHKQEDTGSVIGIKYDVQTHELWYVSNPKGTEEIKRNVHVFEEDGTFLKKYTIEDETPPFLNDLCLTKNAAYITDSNGGRIYKADRNSNKISLFFQQDDIQYTNGIACNDDTGFIYTADFRGITSIALDGKSHVRVTTPKGLYLGGIDGLYIWNDHLIGVQNSMGQNRVIKAKLSSSSTISKVIALDTMREEYRIPPTGVITNNCFYYLPNAQFNLLEQDNTITPENEAKLVPFQVLKIGLMDGEGCT